MLSILEAIGKNLQARELERLFSKIPKEVLNARAHLLSGEARAVWLIKSNTTMKQTFSW